MNEQRDLSASEREQLLHAQQGELDAVLLYQSISSLVNRDELKSVLLDVAADEGRHALVLKEYTGAKLVASQRKARQVGFLYRFLGHRATMKILAKGENKAAEGYRLLIDQFPRLSSIMLEEMEHANRLLALARQK